MLFTLKLSVLVDYNLVKSHVSWRPRKKTAAVLSILQTAFSNSFSSAKIVVFCQGPHHQYIKEWLGVGQTISPWWRHQMETFYALLAICAGNSPVTGEFLAQRPVTRSFDVFFDLRLNKRLSKQSWGWWFETSPRSLWRHCNDYQSGPMMF